MHDFMDYLKEELLSEATGVDKIRISQGLISFQDSKSKVWNVLSQGGWLFSPRHAPNAPKVSTTKKVGAKPTMQMIELPEYTKLVKKVKVWVGDVSADKAKAIVVITAKSGNEQIVFGRYLSTDTEPGALNNKDFANAKYLRVSAKGGKMSQLTASEFLVGSPTTTIMVEKEGEEKPVELFVFKTANALRTTILNNMKASSLSILKDPIVLDETKKFLDSLMKSGTATFNWERIGKKMNEEDRTKLGIFLVSEVGWPFIVMGAGKSIGAGFPGLRGIDFFGVPTSSTNAAFDSCLKGTLSTGGKGQILVSSKAKLKSSKGAAASAMPKLQETAASFRKSGEKPNNPFVAAMLPYITPTNGPSATIMNFGIYEIAKINKSTIPDAVEFWNFCKAYSGYPGGQSGDSEAQLRAKSKKLLAKYSKEEIAQGEKALRAVQKKFASGVTLPGIKVAGVIDQLIAGYLQPKQMLMFARYLPHAICKLIAQGLNHDSSDFVPPKMWQVTADNNVFVASGTAQLTARYLGGGDFKYIFTPGKNPPHDPRRETSWLGYDPL